MIEGTVEGLRTRRGKKWQAYGPAVLPAAREDPDDHGGLFDGGD